MEQQNLLAPTELQRTLLSRALSMLATSGVKYAVFDYEGFKHGTLNVAPDPVARTRAPCATPHGTLKAYVQPYLDKLGVNDMVQIPATDEFTLTRLQSSVSSTAFRMWGEASTMSHQNVLKNVLEVARLS